jgi:uncharacterized membrane protein
VTTATGRWWRRLLGAATIVGLAAVLRWYHLGFQELWLDEAFSFHVATTEDFRQALWREYNPPLYYVLQRPWVHFFGESEAALRSISALTGTLFVAAIIWVGREIFNAAVGLWSGALAAVAPMHVYYSQEARAYALLMLAVLLGYVALWRALRSGSGRWWALFSACTLLSLSTHHFAVLVLMPAAFAVLVAPGKHPIRNRVRRFAAASLLGAGPWLAWVISGFALKARAEGGHAWIRALWESVPPALAIPKTLEVLALGSQARVIPGFFKQFTYMEFPSPLRLLGLGVLVVLGVSVLVPWGDRRLGIHGLGGRKAWLAGLVLLPLVILWLVSLYRPYYFVGRYDVVAFPAYALVLGLALAKLQRVKRWGPLLAPLLALVLLGVLASKLAFYYQAPAASSRLPARPTARAIDALVNHGDLVLLGAWRAMTVNYYLRRLGYERRNGRCENPSTRRIFQCRGLPSESSELGADVDHADRVGFSLEAVREDLREYLEDLGRSGGAVWLERRPDRESAWRALHAMVLEELSRSGYRPARTPGRLRSLGVLRYTRG